MTPLDIAALLVVLAAAFGFINYHLLKLPNQIALVIIGLLSTLPVMAIDFVLPGSHVADAVGGLLGQIDFHEAVMQGMLGFLLFAGALGVDIGELRSQAWAVGVMATIGVLISTAVVGLGFQQIAGVPLLVALTFGALISPTDPVAVLGLIRSARAPKSLEIKITGESLFNDGVGVVVFLIVVALAFPQGDGHAAEVGALAAAELFLVEAAGGALAGAAAGYLGYRLLRTVDDHNLEVMMTLALVMGLYAGCSAATIPGPATGAALHLSGPIAIVVAGLFIGNIGMRRGMQQRTREHVQTFWHLIDEILNAVLFLLIGLEVFVVGELAPAALGVAAAAIPLVLFARFVAVAVPIGLLNLKRGFSEGVVPAMTWGGLRGGISVALVLSLPESEWKPLLLTATYGVVIFSVIVQGLTVPWVVRRFVPQLEQAETKGR